MQTSKLPYFSGVALAQYDVAYGYNRTVDYFGIAEEIRSGAQLDEQGVRHLMRHSRRTAPWIVLVLTLWLVATGCSSDTGPAARPSQHPASAGTPSAAQTPIAARAVDGQDFPLAQGSRRLLTLGTRGAAYVVGANGGDAIYWTSFASGKVREISPPDWEIEQVQVGDRWLAWVEQDAQQSDAMEPVNWRIKAFDFGSGKTRTLLASRSKTQLAPGILLWGNLLFHQIYHGPQLGTSDYRVLDLLSGSDRLVARDVAAGQMVFDGHGLIASVTTNRGTATGGQRSDLFVINQNPPLRITTTGHATGGQFAHGKLLWPNCGPSGCSMMIQDWPNGTPKQLLPVRDTIPALGDGFVTIDGTAEGYGVPVVVPIGSPGQQLELTEPSDQHLAGVPAALGDRVAWMTYRGDEADSPGRLFVATIAVD